VVVVVAVARARAAVELAEEWGSSSSTMREETEEWAGLEARRRLRWVVVVVVG
jgi:hypothetical protein